VLILTASLTACTRSEPEGFIKGMIEDFRQISHPIYYWETVEGRTAVYRMLDSTSDINTIVFDLEGVHDIKSSFNAVYILHDDRNGNLAVTRLENDRALLTEAVLVSEISSTGWLAWDVSGNDHVLVSGIDDDGTYKIIDTAFSRNERERTYMRNEDLTPIISFVETEWFSSSNDIGAIRVAPGADRIAISQPLDDGSDYYGLYFIDGPGESATRIGDRGVMELGGFSPNNEWFLATFEQSTRIDVFLIDNETFETQPVTRVATSFQTGHPSWHPNSRYFFFTTDYTTEFISNSTPLSGEQLYIYSLDSMNDRRLTAFKDVTMWVDFSPIGDFLLYSSAPGAISRMGRGMPDEAAQVQAAELGLETWRIYYVPWVPSEFQTGNIRILTPEETRFLVSWTAGGAETFGFIWGPGEPDVE